MEIDSVPARFVTLIRSMDIDFSCLNECRSSLRRRIVDVMLSGLVIVYAREKVSASCLVTRWVRVHLPSALECPIKDNICPIVKHSDPVWSLIPTYSEDIDDIGFDIADLGAKEIAELILI